jgi:dTDP-4-amino-4,6-dideoxygalactose transaminase
VTTTPPDFVPFALPDIGEEEIAEVVACLRSGWITTGPRAQQFEHDLAAFLGGGVEAVAVNSATAGLHLALEAAGISAGDEVIVPTLTFTATAEVVRYLGAHPRIVDVDAATMNLTAAAVDAAAGTATKAVVPVHMAGLACDMDALGAAAARHRLSVIEDAAHALPSEHAGKLVGTHGSTATVFSFYANKTITTGEGGAVVTADPAIAARCRTMRLHGIDRDAFARYAGSQSGWYYEVVAPGFKYNLTDLAAAIGLHQLRKLPRFQARREALARRYREAFADLPLTLPHAGAPGDRHAWHLFIVRLHDDAPLGRDAFIAAMAARGIACSVHFIPLHRHPYWRDAYGLTPAMFPNAEAIFRGTVSLPLFTRMTDADQERVIDAVRRLLR